MNMEIRLRGRYCSHYYHYLGTSTDQTARFKKILSWHNRIIYDFKGIEVKL